MQVIPPTQINHNNNYETFYKISPNLFTPERLDLFNSIDLYCSLINVSKNLEHGTRLNNISWRIINKALLKDHSINKSKKRDGVKNIYYILNPDNNSKNIIPTNNNNNNNNSSSSNSNNSNTACNNVQSRQSNATSNTNVLKVRPIITTVELFQKYKPQPKSIGNKKEDPQNIIEGFDTSSSSIPTTTTNNETLAKPVMIKKDSLFSATDTNKNNGNIKESHSFFNNDNNNNNKIFFSSEDEYSDWNSISDDDMDYDDDDFYNENDNVIMSTNSNNTTSSRTSSRRSNRNNERIGRSQYRQGTNSNNNNINNKSENRSNKNYRARHNNRYDDEFDEDDDDEEDDQYYRNQWDKLMFTKTENFHTSRPSSMTSSTSNNNNNNHHQHNNNNNGSMTSPDSAKKSLLTGLFSNENNSSNKPTISNHHIPRSQSSTYSINEEANKSTHNTITLIISPHLSNTNISSHNAPLEVVGKKSQPSNSTTTTQVHSRTSSFNNGISLPKKDRYLHESNAPLTAQMILPTALSTHMFLPNNIHQQRLAAKKAAASANITSTTTLRRERTPSEESHSINSNAIVESSDSGGRNQKIGRRRVSMDIPSKNRNSGFLKTRMEISEEEKTVMNRARRTNK